MQNNTTPKPLTNERLKTINRNYWYLNLPCNSRLYSKHLTMNRELTAWRLSNRLSAMIKRQRKLPDTVKNIRYMDSLFRRYYLCLSIINQLPHQKCNYDYKNISIQKPHGTN